MSKISLSQFVGKLRQTGRIGFGDVQRLQRNILPDGIGTRQEAELLIELDRHVSRADDAWSSFLVATLVEFVVWAERPTGVVNEDTARWLAAILSAAPATKTARRIAREVVEEAHAWENDALAGLAASFAKRPSTRPGRAASGARLTDRASHTSAC
jgi:hypothetical protein